MLQQENKKKKKGYKKRSHSEKKLTSHNHTASKTSDTLTLFFEKNRIKFYIGFFIIALLIRVAYIFSIKDLPTFNALSLDPLYHDRVAKFILEHGLLAGTEPFYRSPVYMYVLALIYQLFGVDYLIPRLLNALTGAISVLLIMRCGEKLFNVFTGVVAGFIFMCSWPFIFFDGELLTTSFTIMMGLILVLIFIRTHQHPSWKNICLLGFFFGLTSITRENYFPIIGLAFLFWVIVLRQILKPSVFLLTALLTISPITIRNYLVLDDFVPITHYTGVNFYIGNNPFSNGRTAIVPCTKADWWGGVNDATAIAQEFYDTPIKPSQVNAFWGKETLKYIWTNFSSCTLENAEIFNIPKTGQPYCASATGKCTSFLQNLTRKFFFVFDLYEYSNNKELYFFRDLSPFLSSSVFSLFTPFLYIPFGLLGIILAIAGRKKSAWPLYVILVGYIIGLSLGFVNSRIRMPVMALFIVFSAYSLHYLWIHRHQTQVLLRWLSIPALVTMVSLIINAPSPGHFERATLAGHFIMGNAYLEQGHLEQAERHYQESIKLTVGEYSARSRNSLSEIESKRGLIHTQNHNLTLAQNHFQRALSYQENFQNWINYANTIASLGKEDPVPFYQRAISYAPNDPRGYAVLAQHFLSQGSLEKAVEMFQQAKTYNTNTNVSPSQFQVFFEKLEKDIHNSLTQ